MNIYAKKSVIKTLACAAILSAPAPLLAITYGVQDTNNLYPNVVSVRGIIDETNTASGSCTGSLLHVDAEKYVILTAAHCTDAWIEGIAASTFNSVGVSFEQNNVINGSFSDASYYVKGGIPISLPQKDAPFEKLDYGMVAFNKNNVNFLNETIAQRWGSIPGALTPISLPTASYMNNLITKAKDAKNKITFTAVGYGTGEKFPIPGQQTGPATASQPNLETFVIRFIADNGLTFNAWNPTNDVLRLSMNPAKGESGTCNGDSGGPIFYKDPSLGLKVISIVSGGDYPCRSTNTGPAFMRDEAYNFLSCASVPGNADAVKQCVSSKFGATAKK